MNEEKLKDFLRKWIPIQNESTRERMELDLADVFKVGDKAFKGTEKSKISGISKRR